jgi:uncharacterized protein YcgL (UPF0745 family)
MSIFDEFFFVFSLAQMICSETQNSILSIQKRKSFWWVFCSLVQMFCTKTLNPILSIQKRKSLWWVFCSLAQMFSTKTQNSILSIQKRKSFWWVFCSLVQMFSTKTQNSILSIQNPKKSEQAHLGATQTQIWCLIMPPFGHVMDPFMPPSAHYMAKVYIPWPKFCLWASSIFPWINGSGQG